MFLFLIASAFSEFQVPRFITWNQNVEYQRQFRVFLDGFNPKVTTDRGQYGSSAPQNAVIDSKPHWESGNGPTITDEKPAYLMINFSKALTFERLVFQPRQDVAKGFPLKFKVLVAHSPEDNEFTEIYAGNFPGQTAAVKSSFVCELSQSVSCTCIKFVYLKSDSNFISCHLISFYMNEKEAECKTYPLYSPYPVPPAPEPTPNPSQSPSPIPTQSATPEASQSATPKETPTASPAPTTTSVPPSPTPSVEKDCKAKDVPVKPVANEHYMPYPN